MKVYLVVLQLLWFTTNTCEEKSSNPLTELPLAIRLGETTISEFENKGNCLVKNWIGDGNYTCKTLLINEGRYTVGLNQNEIAISLYFSDENNLSPSATLPDHWRKLGMYLHQNGTTKGTSRADFIKIIKTLGINNIEEIPEKDGKFVKIKFVIDDYYYSVVFREYSSPSFGFESGLMSLFIKYQSY